MANKNFVVHHGLTVGALTIDAATGDINTSGNVVITGNLGVSQISKNDSSVSITDTGSGSSVSITIDNVTEHTIDADGVNLASGDRYAIAGNSVLTANTLGAAVINSSLTSVGNLTSLSVTGAVDIDGALTVGPSITVDNGSYGNVVITQYGSIYGHGVGSNPYSILQTRSSDSITGIGISAYSTEGPLLYSNVGISFGTGLTVRDKDYPTGGVVKVKITADGDLWANATTPSTSTTTGALVVGGGVGVAGNVTATNLSGTILTASQPNITSLGTLSTLAVTGNITVGTGSAAGVVTSKGSYDLTLTTNDTGASAPKITIVQGDNGNIQLDPSGTGVITALSHLYVGDGSTEANISSLGAYNLILSTNRDLGRATITLGSGTDGNIDFSLNGSGTVNIPKVTFADGSTQTKAAIVAGSDSYIQYNNGGSDFGGSANLTFNDTTNQITVGGAIVATTDDATALAIALG